jgi:hypothetical protein
MKYHNVNRTGIYTGSVGRPRPPGNAYADSDWPLPAAKAGHVIVMKGHPDPQGFENVIDNRGHWWKTHEPDKGKLIIINDPGIAAPNDYTLKTPPWLADDYTGPGPAGHDFDLDWIDHVPERTVSEARAEKLDLLADEAEIRMGAPITIKGIVFGCDSPGIRTRILIKAVRIAVHDYIAVKWRDNSGMIKDVPAADFLELDKQLDARNDPIQFALETKQAEIEALGMVEEIDAYNEQGEWP